MSRIARVNIRGLKWIKSQYQYNLVSIEIIDKLNEFIDELIKEQEERFFKGE